MQTQSERIRQAREANDLNRAELARRVGVKPSAAVQWEQQPGTLPSAANLAKIAKITGVSFEWLATGRGTSRLLATRETSAIEIASFAHNLFEERLLQMARAMPPKARESLVRFLEALLPRPGSQRSAKRKINSDT
jgi:transcriptional regulator with XRE-family HTH domain